MEGYNRLESFDFEVDNWDAYRERLEQLFHINGHAGSEEADLARRRAVLLTVCGKKTYELLRTLAAPAKPADKTYNELCTLLEGRCSTKPSLVMRRFKFHSRNRDSGESVTNFVTALRKLAAECEFTDLDDQLRDRIVCGINDAEMQRQMLRETTLNLKKAISIATTTEATERQVSQLVTAQKASRSELDTAKSSERAKNETGIHRTAHSTTGLKEVVRQAERRTTSTVVSAVGPNNTHLKAVRLKMQRVTHARRRDTFGECAASDRNTKRSRDL